MPWGWVACPLDGLSPGDSLGCLPRPMSPPLSYHPPGSEMVLPDRKGLTQQNKQTNIRPIHAMQLHGVSGRTLPSVPRSEADHPGHVQLHCPVAGRATPSAALAARFRAQLSYLATPVGGEGENQQQSDEPMESVSRANQRPSARRRELELFISFPVFAGPPVTSTVPYSRS